MVTRHFDRKPVEIYLNTQRQPFKFNTMADAVRWMSVVDRLEKDLSVIDAMVLKAERKDVTDNWTPIMRQHFSDDHTRLVRKLLDDEKESVTTLPSGSTWPINLKRQLRRKSHEA